MSDLIDNLQKLGFVQLLTDRIGPCDKCKKWDKTYYNPESKIWLCKECTYNE